MIRLKSACAWALAVGLLLPLAAAAQSAALQPVPEMEDFWHIFIAYAIAWILLFGWLISIVRRIRRVEERLGD